MKLLGLFCINFLMVNIIVAVTLRDQYQNPILRLTQLQYEDYKYQVVKKLGIPTTKASGKWHYHYDAQNNLVINWKDDRLSYARVDFSKPILFNQLGISDRVVLIESNQNWAKVGIPNQGHRFEVNSLGALLSWEVSAPWKQKRNLKSLSAILFDVGLTQHMALQEFPQ